MCGIAGILSKYNYQKSQNSALMVKEMLKCFKYRGPDSLGLFCSQGVCIGSVRLNIVDDKYAKQPFVSNCTGDIIVFNGEIYNYKELKIKLQNKHLFKSHGDTEVLIHLFEEYGLKCLEYLNGMFSFCIVCGNEVYLIRDRFGIKPLYYKYSNNKLYFSSEAKALAKIVIDLDINLNEDFNGLESLIAPETLFKKIYELPAGHYIKYNRNNGSYIIDKYYQLLPQKRFLFNARDNIEYFKFLLKDAINLRIDTEKSYGCFVSGGVDSAAVTSMANPNLLLSSVCMEKESYLDERKYLNLLQQQNKQKLIRIKLDPKFFPEHFVKMVYSLDFPVGSLSAYPQYILSKEANKRGLKIMLNGLGADEYLAGYVRHAIFRKNLNFILNNKNFKNYKGFLKRLSEKKYKSNIGLYASIINRSDNCNTKVINRISNYFKNNDNLTALSLIEIDLLLPALLRIDDRINMYHGIESRAPFLDYRLVEFCLGLGEEYKLRTVGNDIISKFILRQACKGIVHPVILKCKVKTGFPSPVNIWLNGQYRYSLKRAYDIVKKIHKLNILFDENIFEDNQQFSRKRWLLLQFATWHLLFFENKSIENVEEILFK